MVLLLLELLFYQLTPEGWLKTFCVVPATLAGFGTWECDAPFWAV